MYNLELRFRATTGAGALIFFLSFPFGKRQGNLSAPKSQRLLPFAIAMPIADPEIASDFRDKTKKSCIAIKGRDEKSLAICDFELRFPSPKYLQFCGISGDLAPLGGTAEIVSDCANFPDPPILAFFNFLAFFVFRFSLLFCAFFLSFLRILGVPRREKPLAFLGINPCFFQKSKDWRVGERGLFQNFILWVCGFGGFDCVKTNDRGVPPPLSFLSLFFWKKAGNTTKKTQGFFIPTEPHKKNPEKKGKNGQKTRNSFPCREKKKQGAPKKTRKGRTGPFLNVTPFQHSD